MTSISPCGKVDKVLLIMKFILTHSPSIVGVIASQADLSIAVLKPDVDFFEWRVDALPDLATFRQLAPRLGKPVIVTIRDPDEGGLDKELHLKKRIKLYKDFMPFASAIDIEARNIEALNSIIELVKSMHSNCALIISRHDFEMTPSIEELAETALLAKKVKADVFKVATKAHNLTDIAKLIAFATEFKVDEMQLALMAMGHKFGRISRLLLAVEGSTLIYGYLAKPPLGLQGQWCALDLRKKIAELTS